MKSKRFLFRWGVALVLSSVYNTSAQAQRAPLKSPQVKSAGQTTNHDWCGTMPDYLRHKGLATKGENDCPTGFAPDVPATRNANIPTPSTPFKTVRLSIHIFTDDSGSNHNATVGAVNAMVADMSADFASARIKFDARIHFRHSTRFLSIPDPAESPAEATAMKEAFADEPGRRLNIFIVNNEPNSQGGTTNGLAVFPWDARALTKQGGMILDDDRVGAGFKTVSHEMGHCLGLWHTHKGVSESSCGTSCYESAGRSAAIGDVTGDFCADTPATPVNYSCSEITNNPTTPEDETKDPCNNVSWGATDSTNYMGYGLDVLGCRNNFTPQHADECTRGSMIL